MHSANNEVVVTSEYHHLQLLMNEWIQTLWASDRSKSDRMQPCQKENTKKPKPDQSSLYMQLPISCKYRGQKNVKLKQRDIYNQQKLDCVTI